MAQKNILTRLVHNGVSKTSQAGAVNVPVYLTSTFDQGELGVHPQYGYARGNNPTREALETLIADLEGGAAGFAFASGMAATTAALSLFKTGDKILVSSNIYGGTYDVLDKVFSNFGITFSAEDTTDIRALESKITSDVKGIFIETPANPLLTVTDLRAAADFAKRHSLLSIVDNTFMSPYLQRPLEFGIDVVVQSATKYLGGHSDLIAGLVVTKTKELGDRIHQIQALEGAILQPFDSFLLIRGIKTLGVRLDRHVENAERIADFLVNNEAVKKVYYPGLKDDPGYEINKSQAKNGGAMLSFELDDNYDQNKFFHNLHLITLGASLGGAESLICHPATMSHASIPAEIRKKAGISDSLIRLSPGIENADDLIAELDHAIKTAKRV